MMQLQRFGISIALCLLAGALAADNKYHRWNGPLPELVEQHLPASIPARDVLVQDGCFFYLYEGKVFQLLNANEGAKGLPICIG